MSAPHLQSVLHPAGPDALIISQFAWVMFIAGAVILAGVMLLLALSLRSGVRARKPLRPLLWIAGGGIALPLILLSALLVWSTWRAAELTRQSSSQKLVISVTAKMWWWEVRYRDPDRGDESGNESGADIVSANELHLPVGTPVYLALSSGDVIHSFWVPALGGKVDTLPGRMTGLTVTAGRPGVLRGQCAEFCGEQHARMGLQVVAQAPAEFAEWLRRQRQAARVPVEPALLRGRQVYAAQRCAACHTLREAGVGPAAAARTGDGPDLTHVGARLSLGAATVPASTANLAAWIANPHAVKPGVHMPASADIAPADLQALAAYLASLK